jgi:ATP-dependent DNA helicase DinG
MYATATINLQGQLAENEIPLLRSIGLVANPIIAKGKAHYYCHYRMKNQDREQSSPLFSPKDREVLEKFYNTGRTGQRSELEGNFKFDIEDEKWEKVELLMNSNCWNCSLSGMCPTFTHRRRFKSNENDVVITNHDQLIMSFLNAMDIESIYEPVLNTNVGVVVIDEAHDFLETFIGRLEKTFTISRLKRMEIYIARSRPQWISAVNELRKWIEKLKTDNQKSDTGRFMLTDIVITQIKKLYEILNENLLQAKYRAADILDELSSILYCFIHKDKYTSWISLEDDVFHVVENNYKSVFRRMLDYITGINKVIFMSGTLTVNGDFSYIMNHWNIRPKEAVTKGLDSPFDYKNQALVYIPEGLGNPNSETFIEKALQEVNKLLRLTGGRTLLLNTSKHHMDAFHIGIKDILSSEGISLLKQGESGVEKLTKRFKEAEESVLVGSGSFFSGFSIAGKSLTSVILNKLPFPAHRDPIVELLSIGLKSKFKEVTYPMMVNKLDQGVGRLIRSIEDFGIITILDERLYTEDYGIKVQELLEGHGYVLTRSWDEVEYFYNRKLEKGGEAEYKPYSRQSLDFGSQIIRPNKKLQENKERVNKKIEEKKANMITSNITKSQISFLQKICRNNGFMIILKGNTELVFKEVCLILYEKGLEVDQIMKSFPYRNKEEEDVLKNYLHLSGTRKTVETIYHEKIGERKSNTIKKEQREFLKRLIQKEGLTQSIGRYVDHTFKSFYDNLYSNWKDVQYLRDNFPYQDEEEKRVLSIYYGGIRKRVYPFCTKLGCSGNCSAEEHSSIKEYLINTHGATKVSFFAVKGVHRVQIEPIEILDHEELRPDELLLTK